MELKFQTKSLSPESLSYRFLTLLRHLHSYRLTDGDYANILNVGLFNLHL